MSDISKGSPSKSKSRGGHCKRFWWVYVVVLVVIVVIVVPVVLLVAVPKIAQQKIDAAVLHIDSINIGQTETQSLNMAINSTITTDGGVHATIAGFDGTMYLTDYDPPLEFASINFPETSSDSLVLVNVSQTIPVGNLTDLTIFNTYLLTRDLVHIQIKGDTTVRVSGIARDYPVTFDKTVEVVGFNSFSGLSVENPNVSLKPTNNFNGTAVLPNPTVWTIDVGNATFLTFFNGSGIGTTNVNNMVLRPGNNSFFISGTIDQGAVLNGLAQKPYCQNGGLLPIQLTGDTVVNNGQSIPYLSGALAAKNLSVTVDIGSAVTKDIGITVPCVVANSTLTNSTARR